MKQKVNDPKAAYEYFASKNAFTTGATELSQSREQGEKYNLIDVRKKEDYAKGHIPGAVNLSEEEWRSYKGLSKDNNNVLYGYNSSCRLASKAGYHFAEGGYPVMELEGGFKAWKDADYAIEAGDASNYGSSDHKKSA
jgi:rhodanese-related sulfurtransferase